MAERRQAQRVHGFNALYNTNFDTSSERFENYYKDLSLRLKNREIDLVIVVNMFLTGFDAIALFGNRNAREIVLLKPYGDSCEEYETKVGELLESFPLGMRILGETAERAFIALVGAILKLRNILTTFDEFAGNDILTDRQVQGSLSRYLDLYAEYRRTSDRAPSLPHVHMPRTHVT